MDNGLLYVVFHHECLLIEPPHIVAQGLIHTLFNGHQMCYKFMGKLGTHELAMNRLAI